MRRIGELALFLAGASVLLGAPSGTAEAQQTRWVDAANCPGPGSGTEADPYCKIQDAICNIKNTGGGTVYVRSGTYNEAIRLFAGIDLISTGGPTFTTIDPTQSLHQARLHGRHDPPVFGSLLRARSQRSLGGFPDHERQRNQPDLRRRLQHPVRWRDHNLQRIPDDHPERNRQ